MNKAQPLRHPITAAAAITAAAMLAAVPFTAARAAALEVVTFAVPPEGTSGYLLVSAMSKVITEKTPVKKIVLQTFGGAAGWPARMQTGEVNFAAHCGFKPMQEAYTGTGAFEKAGKMPNVLSLATGHGLAYAVSVVDPEIKTIAQLKGKTLFVQTVHHDQLVAAQVMAKAAGLVYGKDIKIISFRALPEANQGLMTGKADGVTYALVPGLAEVQQAKGLHPLPMPENMMQQIMDAEPVWGTTVIKAGTPPLKPEVDTPTIEIQCGLAAGGKTDPETVYQVTKAIFENLSGWNGVHPVAKQWSLERATKIAVVPYHEGAIRYFKEMGVWTAAMDAKQKALLAKN
jgi:TRAP transporter TAXI family solute receptor